jgi:hypothetical protein
LSHCADSFLGSFLWRRHNDTARLIRLATVQLQLVGMRNVSRARFFVQRQGIRLLT